MNLIIKFIVVTISWYPQPRGQMQVPHCQPQTIEENLTYVASRESFRERIKEELNLEVIKAPLTRADYKKKFHHQICWEEKRHIEVLEEK